MNYYNSSVLFQSLHLHLIMLTISQCAHPGRHDQFILLSTPYDTRLMELQPKGTMAELDSSTFSGLVCNTPTIAAGNLCENGGKMFVQVTNEAVNIINLTTGVSIPPWQGQITVADVNLTQIVVALRGGDIVHLTYRDGMGLEVQKCIISYLFSSHPSLVTDTIAL